MFWWIASCVLVDLASCVLVDSFMCSGGSSFMCSTSCGFVYIAFTHSFRYQSISYTSQRCAACSLAFASSALREVLMDPGL